MGKIDSSKFQVVDKTSELKTVMPNEKVTIELNMTGGTKPVKKIKILNTLQEEINKQRLRKENKEIEIRIMSDDEIGLLRECWLLFKRCYIKCNGLAY